MAEKRCPKCGETKLDTEWPPSGRGKGGAWCQACLRAAFKLWVKRNPEKVAAQARRRDQRARERDPERFRAKALARTRKWRENHANREKQRLSSLAWKKRNPERVAAQRQRYNLEHPHYGTESSTVQRARQYGVAENGRVNRQAIIDRDKGTCYLCGAKPVPEDLTLDHVVPLSKGGPHLPENVRVACRHCNAVKHDRLTATAEPRLAEPPVSGRVVLAGLAAPRSPAPASR